MPLSQTNTRIEFDVPEYVSTDSGLSGFRRGYQIAPLGVKTRGADGAVCRNMRYWKSGCWTLQPIQEHFSFCSEYPDPNFDPKKYTYGPASIGQIIGLLAETSMQYIYAALWAAPFGTGFIHSGTQPTTGDPVYRRQVPASMSWMSASDLTPPPPQLSTEASPITGIPEFLEPKIPLDVALYTKSMQPGDQGFFLRWLCPGTSLSRPDAVLNFYFGQYCLIIGGSGEAILAEYCQAVAGGAYRWKKRDTFRYCRESGAIGVPHGLVIFPHKSPDGRNFIIVSGGDMDTGTGGVGGLITAGGGQGIEVVNNEYLYEATELNRFNDIEDDPGHVTKSAPIRLDIRRDLRIAVHISRLAFQNSGGIIDGVWGVPDYSLATFARSGVPASPFLVNIRATYPPDAFQRKGVIDYSVADQSTRSVTDVKNPFVALYLNGTASTGNGPGASPTTPVLWGYELYREANRGVINPGMFSLPAVKVSLGDIAGNDPRAEHGQVTAHDVYNTASRLTNRSHLSARVVFDYTPPTGGTTQAVVLARGYVLRPRNVKRGKPTSRTPNWNEWSFLMTGMSDRVDAVTGRSITYEHFALDPNAPVYTSGQLKDLQPGWKITDIVSYILKSRGFPSSQVLIDDLPTRLHSVAVLDSQHDIYDAKANPMEWCCALCRNYLSAYLIWDANAGPTDQALIGSGTSLTPAGAWRILRPPIASDTPMWNFVTNRTITDPVGGAILPHGSAAYAANTGPITDNVRYSTIRPEGNHLWLFTAPPFNGAGSWRSEAHLFNYRSYKVPGMTAQPDANSAHYLGFEKMIIVPDAGLIVPGSMELTQRAVNIAARRVFTYACLPRQVMPVRSPLVIVNDLRNGRPRPLRYYDAVTVNGQGGWYVRTPTVEITAPNHWGTYELERIVPLT